MSFTGIAKGQVGINQVLGSFLNEKANLRKRCVFALWAYDDKGEVKVNVKTIVRDGALNEDLVSHPLIGVQDLFLGGAANCHFLRDNPTLNTRDRVTHLNRNNIHALLCIVATMRKSLHTIFPPSTRMITTRAYHALLPLDNTGRKLPGEVELKVLTGPRLKLRFNYACDSRGKVSIRFKMFYEDLDREFILRKSQREGAVFGYVLERVGHQAPATARNPRSGVLVWPPYEGFTIDDSLGVMRQLNAMFFHSCTTAGGRQEGKMKVTYHPDRRLMDHPVVRELTTLSCFKTETEDSAHVAAHRRTSKNLRDYGTVPLPQDWFR